MESGVETPHSERLTPVAGGGHTGCVSERLTLVLGQGQGKCVSPSECGISMPLFKHLTRRRRATRQPACDRVGAELRPTVKSCQVDGWTPLTISEARAPLRAAWKAASRRRTPKGSRPLLGGGHTGCVSERLTPVGGGGRTPCVSPSECGISMPLFEHLTRRRRATRQSACDRVAAELPPTVESCQVDGWTRSTTSEARTPLRAAWKAASRGRTP